MPHRRPKSRDLCALPLVACAIALMFSLLPVRPASASCSAEAAPSAVLAGMTTAPVNELNPHLPAPHVCLCLVTGSIVANPSPGKTLGFGLTLPM